MSENLTTPATPAAEAAAPAAGAHASPTREAAPQQTDVQRTGPQTAEAPGAEAPGADADEADAHGADPHGADAHEANAQDTHTLGSTAVSAATPRRGAPMFPDGTGPAADPAGSHHERRIRSFQPRRSRVSPSQADALRRLWPTWGLDIDGLSRIDLDAFFDGLPVVLEIGFGMGEATAQMAAADPDTGILGCDVHTPGQGNLLGLAERNGLSNIRVANGDAIILLREMLAPASLAGLRVYFPDPWPKKRHHKRRLVQPEFIALAVTRLAPGALVHCATDWEPYAEQMLDVLSAEPALENLYPGYAPRPDFRPLTKFEGQGLDKGHVVHDLLFRRRDT
ncbi:tRNA (guanine-N7-)-methyltransferase [Streptomyces sp. 2224.1]|uniref:tRNA (guanosine(46)-N7)-methyltransferase TrmB n=1 Tax=Streptomyces sp. 2224.1 TaxID=1881020 RepID=UPI0008999295|nr:tRNA (guanosine(46)-N7)-methyltransferase TrmB [Streptomyces sp. 2224.1]SEC10567.1 tRNA (guanine-N7-)-methyltransferase [Streptomyces sp. 2224.1]